HPRDRRRKASRTIIRILPVIDRPNAHITSRRSGDPAESGKSPRIQRNPPSSSHLRRRIGRLPRPLHVEALARHERRIVVPDGDHARAHRVQPRKLRRITKQLPQGPVRRTRRPHLQNLLQQPRRRARLPQVRDQSRELGRLTQHPRQVPLKRRRRTERISAETVSEPCERSAARLTRLRTLLSRLLATLHRPFVSRNTAVLLARTDLSADALLLLQLTLCFEQVH